MAYDVVIFDLDGTLLDTLDDLMDSCNYALSTIGAPPRTRAEIRRFVGNGIRNLMLQAVPDGADNPKFEQAYETMQTWYKAHNQIKTAPYPGVQRLIRTLKQQGVPMAVVSNKPDASVQMLVEQWFPEITFGLGEPEAGAGYGGLRHCAAGADGQKNGVCRRFRGRLDHSRQCRTGLHLRHLGLPRSGAAGGTGSQTVCRHRGGAAAAHPGII